MDKTYTISLSEQIDFAGGTYYLVQSVDGKENILTFGDTVEEAFDNMADALMTMEGVKVGWWNKLLHKLRRY